MFTTIRRGDAAADGGRQDRATPYPPQQVIFRAGLQTSLVVNGGLGENVICREDLTL